MTIKSGNICNNAGSATAWSGSSLICNGARQSAVLNIKGGTFSQDYFIAVKNDECGTLNISGGEIASLTQAVQNWCKAKISGGDLTGDVTSWTYLNTSAETIITGGTIDGSVQLHKLTYSNTPATNIPVTKISGTANVKGAFFVGSRIWGEETSTADPDAGNLTISGGTFASDPSAYLADGYRVTGSAGNFEVSETPPYIPPVPDQGDDKDEGTTDPSNPEDMPEDGFGTDSEGDTYFFKDGRMVTGWVEQDGTWYYMDEETGVMNTETWLQVDGTWYNFNEDGEMLTGWQKVDGIWYYMKDWGGMATGWQWINGVWYYLYSWGGMATGWVYDNGTWYYMQSWGGMATGWQQVGGKWYYLYSNGAMAANTTIDGYVLGADGAMR